MRLRKKQMPVLSLDTPPRHTDKENTEFWPRQLEDWHWNPETITLSGELQRVMDEAVAALPEQLRSVFVLRDLEELSTQETAEVLDISPANAKVRLHRARLMLREHLAGYFSEQSGEVC